MRTETRKPILQSESASLLSLLIIRDIAKTDYRVRL